MHGRLTGFYTGPIAAAIVAAVQARGGCLTLEDLAAHATQMVDPISSTYRWLWPPAYLAQRQDALHSARCVPALLCGALREALCKSARLRHAA
jgi:hypothetical protein